MITTKREAEALAKLFANFDRLSEFDKGVIVGKAEALDIIDKEVSK